MVSMAQYQPNVMAQYQPNRLKYRLRPCIRVIQYILFVSILWMLVLWAGWQWTLWSSGYSLNMDMTTGPDTQPNPQIDLLSGKNDNILKKNLNADSGVGRRHVDLWDDVRDAVKTSGRNATVDPDPEEEQALSVDGQRWLRDFLHTVNGTSGAGTNTRRFSLDVMDADIDRFHVTLPKPLEDFKNPCWVEEIPAHFTYEKTFYRECPRQPSEQPGMSPYADLETALETKRNASENWRIRCFPYFFVLGVSTTGEADLHNILMANAQDVVTGTVKEHHYWEYRRCLKSTLCRSVPRRLATFADYLDSFDVAAEAIQKSVSQKDNTAAFHTSIIGDFTSTSLTYDPCWKFRRGNSNRKEPQFTMASYLHSIRPQTKFIVVLREPVERFYTEYHMGDDIAQPKKGKFDPFNFHREAKVATEEFMKCHEWKGSSRACAYVEGGFDFMRFLTKSLYQIFVSDWISVFPRDQFLFLRWEDFRENKAHCINKVFKFLEIEPLTPRQIQEVSDQEPPEMAPPADMLNRTRNMLQDFFRPFNQRLAGLLEDDSYTWGY